MFDCDMIIMPRLGKIERPISGVVPKLRDLN